MRLRQFTFATLSARPSFSLQKIALETFSKVRTASHCFIESFERKIVEYTFKNSDDNYYSAVHAKYYNGRFKRVSKPKPKH